MASVSMPAEAAAMPDPGDELVQRVTGTTDREWFYWTGRESVRDIERTLSVAGRELASFSSILDFGCGCGRMLMWLEDLAGDGRRICGTDVDAEAIAWAGENLPYCELGVNPADPPLAYADATFDLVYNHSVFTHIDEQRQDAWLGELRRIVRPGGLLVLSTHAETAIDKGGYDVRDQLEREGIVFLEDVHPPGFALPDWYQVTYHAPWYVFEHWARWFEIKAYVPGAALGLQDHVLLERTDGPPRRPLRAPARAAPPAPHTPHAASPTRAPSRFGPLGILGRRALLRALRPYSFHQDRAVEAIAAELADVRSTVREQAERLAALEQR